MWRPNDSGMHGSNLCSAVVENTHEVVVLTDSELLRRGLSPMLENIPEIIFHSVDSLPESWSSASPGPVRVVIVDVDKWALLGSLPFDSGDRPRVLVVGDESRCKEVSLHADRPFDGFLSLADISAESLRDTLERIISGEVAMPAVLARQLIAESRAQLSPHAARKVLLTAREGETLNLLAKGLSNKQIARMLGISTHGVKRLVGAVLLKLGAPNRTTAVVMAMNAGLL